MKVITLGLPSFRPENAWIFEYSGVVVVGHRLAGHSHSFGDRNVGNSTILSSFSHIDSIDRSIEPSCFLLDPIHIHKLLQILIIEVLIGFEHFLYLPPESFFDMRVVDDQIDHHGEEMRSCISTTYDEGAELVKEVLVRVFVFSRTCFLRSLLLINQSFN